MKEKTLYELRVQSGKSLSEVSASLGTTVKILSEYEQGIRGLGIMRTVTLARIYGCSVSEVVKAQKNIQGEKNQ